MTLQPTFGRPLIMRRILNQNEQLLRELRKTHTLAQLADRFSICLSTVRRYLFPADRELHRRCQRRLQREGKLPPRERVCQWCCCDFQSVRERYCSAKCRKLAVKNRKFHLPLTKQNLLDHAAHYALTNEAARRVGMTLKELKKAIE